MPLLSLEDVSGVRTEPVGIARTPQTARRGLSIEDVSEGSAAPTSGGLTVGGFVTDQGKRTFENIAAAVDMLAGLPGQALAVGANIGGRLGEVRPGGTAASARKAGAEAAAMIPTSLQQPINTLMKAFGYEGGYDKSDVAQILHKAVGYVEQGGDKLEQATGGRIGSQDVTDLVNTVMLAAGGKGTAMGVDPKLAAAGRVTPKGQFSGPYKGKLDAKRMQKFADTAAETERMAAENAAAEAAAAEAAAKPVEAVASKADERSKVRSAFSEDPQVTDQLSPYRAEGMAERTRAPHETLMDVEPKVLESKPPASNQLFGWDEKKGLWTPNKADAGGLVSRGRQFDLTAQEKVALNANRSAWKRPEIIIPAVAATGVGLASVYADQDPGDTALAMSGAMLVGRGKGLTLDAIKAMSPASAVGTIRSQMAYTLRTVERIPDNWSEVPRKWLDEQLKRPDVTAAEKQVFAAVLEGRPAGEPISARDLFAGIKEATGDFELKRDATDQFADYGLSEIGRDRSPTNIFDGYRAEDLTVESNARGDRWIISAPGFEGARSFAKSEFPTAEEALRQARIDANAPPPPAENAITHVWQLPFDISTANHFGDPKYFGHTRSFEEGGVRHVVEIQNDLAQKAGKVLSAEERAGLEGQRQALFDVDAELSSLQQQAPFRSGNHEYKLAAIESAYKRLSNTGKALMNKQVEKLTTKLTDVDSVEATIKAAQSSGQWGQIALSNLTQIIRRAAEETRVGAAEISTKLQASGAAERVQPLLKNWPKRLVREELADAARSKPNPVWEKAKIELERAEWQLQDDVERVGNLYPDMVEATRETVANRKAKLDATPKELPPEPSVRFATADTVAKVEGWPDSGEARRTQLAGAQERLTSAQNHVAVLEAMKRGEPPKDDYYSALKIADPEAFDRVVRHIDAELSYAQETLRESQLQFDRIKNNWGDQTRFRPEHQSIYDRYQKDTEKFLRQLGGKPYTDQHGHTWLEVPTAGTKEMPAGKRVQQFGLSSPELLGAITAIGGGMALTAYLSKPENRVRNSAIAAAVMGLGMWAHSRSSAVRDYAEKLGSGADFVLGEVSTRLGNMSRPLQRRLDQLERKTLIRGHDYISRAAPLAEKLSKKFANKEALKAAILTNEPSQILAELGKTGDPDIVADFKNVRKLLDEVGADLVRANKLKNLLPDYFPRVVIDLPGLLEAVGKTDKGRLGELLEAAEKTAAKSGKGVLSPLETSQIINKYFKEATGSGGRPGFLKPRSINEIPPEFVRFYAPPGEGLLLNLRAAARVIERAEFFGDDAVRTPEGQLNVDESIGNLVRKELAAGKIDYKQAAAMKSMLQNRFGPGEAAMSRPLQAVKNITYMGLLANPFSAFTNLGDTATAVAAHGILSTAKSVAAVITKDPQRYTVQDLGLINHIIEDMVVPQRKPLTVADHVVSLSKMTEKSFKLAGFSPLDTAGKAIIANAAWDKWRRLAKTEKGKAELAYQFKDYFGPDFERLRYDLEHGKKTELTDELIFRELADLQPITKAEMPEGWNAHPNARIAYTLRSFTIKQADIIRRKAFNEIRKGTKEGVRRGVTDLVRFGMAMGISGALPTAITSYILYGVSSVDWKDVPDKMLSTFALSRYVVDKVRQGKPIEGLFSAVAPPWKMWQEILTADPSAVKYLPIIGKPLEARAELGRGYTGAEKKQKQEEKRERREARDN